jgi:cell division transport system permease protein
MRFSPFNLISILVPYHPLQDGWKSFKRHRTLTIATVLLIGLMVFIFNVVFSIRILTDEIFSFLNEKVDVSVELTTDAPVTDITNLATRLSRQNFVKEARYISNEDALATVDQELIPGYKGFLERYDLQNPFSPTLNIITYSVSDHDKVFEYLSRPEYQHLIKFESLETPEEELLSRSAATELRRFSKLINSVVFVVLFLFGLASIAILVNALYLSLKAKKREISIMHIVGATEKYIAYPYTVEGVLYGLFSVILGQACFYLIILFGGMELFPIIFSPLRIILQTLLVAVLSGVVSFVMVSLRLRGKIRL